MEDGSRARPPTRPPSAAIGEAHRVEVLEVQSIGQGWDYLAIFGDLDRPHRRFIESCSRSEVVGLSIGDRGELARVRTRTRREGRWVFKPEGQGGEGG